MLTVGARLAEHEQRQLAEKQAAISSRPGASQAVQGENKRGGRELIILHKDSTPLLHNSQEPKHILSNAHPWGPTGLGGRGNSEGDHWEAGGKESTMSWGGVFVRLGPILNGSHSFRLPCQFGPAFRVLPQHFATWTHKMLRDADDYEFEELALEHTWTFWHHPHVESKSEKDYEDALTELCDFSTVQDFWRCFNNLPTPTELRKKSTLHMMKRGVAPKWEDPYNEDGGHWVIRLKKEATENVWKDLVLTIIGEQLTLMLNGHDEICGVSVSVRDYDNIIRIWNRNANSLVRDDILTSTKSLFSESDARLTFYKAHKNLKLEKRYQRRGGGVAPSPRVTAKATSPKPTPPHMPYAPQTILAPLPNRIQPDSHRHHSESPPLYSRSFENDGWARPRSTPPSDECLWKRREERGKPKAHDGFSRKLEYPPFSAAHGLAPRNRNEPHISSRAAQAKSPRFDNGARRAPPPGKASGKSRTGMKSATMQGGTLPSFAAKSGGKKKKGRSKSHLGNKLPSNRRNSGKSRGGSRNESTKSSSRRSGKPKQASPPKRRV